MQAKLDCRLLEFPIRHVATLRSVLEASLLVNQPNSYAIKTKLQEKTNRKSKHIVFAMGDTESFIRDFEVTENPARAFRGLDFSGCCHR